MWDEAHYMLKEGESGRPTTPLVRFNIWDNAHYGIKEKGNEKKQKPHLFDSDYGRGKCTFHSRILD